MKPTQDGERLVKLCPRCGQKGSLVLREVTNGRSPKVYKHHYFDHRTPRGNVVHHYIPEAMVPEVKLARVVLVPIVAD